jgi:hypothetical protein
VSLLELRQAANPLPSSSAAVNRSGLSFLLRMSNRTRTTCCVVLCVCVCACVCVCVCVRARVTPNKPAVQL